MNRSLSLHYKRKREISVGMCSRSTTPLVKQLSWVAVVLGGDCPRRRR